MKPRSAGYFERCPEAHCRQALTIVCTSCRERTNRAQVSHVFALQSASDRSSRIRVRFSSSGATQRNVHTHRNGSFGHGYGAMWARISIVHTSGTTGEHPAMLGRAACGRPAAAAIGRTVAQTGEADGDGGTFAGSAADGN